MSRQNRNRQIKAKFLFTARATCYYLYEEDGGRMCVAEYIKTVEIRKAEFLAVVEETEAEGKKEGW